MSKHSNKFSRGKTRKLIKLLELETPKESFALTNSYIRITELINEGANPNASLMLSAIKLHNARYWRESKDNTASKKFLYKIFEVSLEKGANLNSIILPNFDESYIYSEWDSCRAYQRAKGARVHDLIVDLETAEIVQKHSGRFEHGSNSIFRALERCNTELVKYLLDNGVSINGEYVKYSALDGSMPHKNFLLSVVKGASYYKDKKYPVYKEIIEIALNHLSKDLLKKINEKYNIVDCSGNYEIVKLLIDKDLKPSKESDALTTAARLGDIEFIKLLIDNGVDINGIAVKKAITAILSDLNNSYQRIEYNETLDERAEYSKKLTAVFKYFIDQGVGVDFVVEQNPHYISFTESWGSVDCSLLDCAPNAEITEILIEKGVKIKNPVKAMYNALYTANYTLFKYIADQYQDFESGNGYGEFVQDAVNSFEDLNKFSDQYIKDVHKIMYMILERGGVAHLNNYDNIDYKSALWLERAAELTKIFNKETNLADDKDSVIPVEQIKEYLFLLKKPEDLPELIDCIAVCNENNQNKKNIREQLNEMQSLQFLSCVSLLNTFKNNPNGINLELTKPMQDYCIDLSKYLPEVLNFAVLGETN